MTLSGESTIYMNKTTGQMVICIPAKIVVDSKFSFKAGDRVEIKQVFGDSKDPVLVIRKSRRRQ